jgi:hypothetical protein
MSGFIPPYPHRHPELVSGSIPPHIRNQRRQAQPHRQIPPLGIRLVDEVDLPLPMPTLQLLLTQDRSLHVCEQFEADKPVNFVLRRKSRRRAFAVLPNPTEQIRSNAGIKRPVMTTGENVDARFFFAKPHAPNNADKWILKQVQDDVLEDIGVAPAGMSATVPRPLIPSAVILNSFQDPFLPMRGASGRAQPSAKSAFSDGSV